MFKHSKKGAKRQGHRAQLSKAPSYLLPRLKAEEILFIAIVLLVANTHLVTPASFIEGEVEGAGFSSIGEVCLITVFNYLQGNLQKTEAVFSVMHGKIIRGSGVNLQQQE